MYRLPKKQLAAIKEWNSGRRELQLALGDDIFVPKVTLYEDEKAPGPVLTGITWTQMVPIALPEVNEILLLATSDKRRLRWDDVAPLLESYERYDASNVLDIDGDDYPRRLPFFLLDYEEAPAELLALEKRARRDTLLLVDIDDVVAT